MRKLSPFLLALFLFISFSQTGWAVRKTDIKEKKVTESVWSLDKANKWYAAQPWLTGCNYIPASAINQIEMWHAQSFDPKGIEKEMLWAQELGFNTMRVFLSSVVWKNDPVGMKQRMDQFLQICQNHSIKPIFVFFDDCWNAESAIGKQPAPLPGVHNSGWVQDPAASLRNDTTRLFPVLENYMKDILTTFKNDKRILMWDLYNEPGNNRHGISSFPLLKNVFKWARQARPNQPITVGVWWVSSPEITVLSSFQIHNSDIITYHNYEAEKLHENWINFLKMNGRPLICTEYMARTNESYFGTVMPMLKKQNVGAINWGFVAGKTNTIFSWNQPLPEQKEPKIWFHDIYRADKTPFDSSEITLIKRLNGVIDTVNLISPQGFEREQDGKKVSLFTLKNKAGMVAQITNFGGRVVALWTPDRESKYADIVTGYKTLDGYLQSHEIYFGALIGRFGNRIAKGQFSIDSVNYQLETNNWGNHIHGGAKGFHNVVWDAKRYKNELQEDVLELKYLSPNGDQNYPGNLSVTVLYTLTEDNSLRIDYSATTDQKTIVNLTNHTFFNLLGFSSGTASSINSHLLKINATKYTPTDKGLIPTGKIASVVGTPMDFTKPTVIGDSVNSHFQDIKNGKGYDHNWVLDIKEGQLAEAVVVYEPISGRQMSVYTTEPAIQFYGGNFFEGKDKGKYGEVYNFRTSFVLETQHFPDSPNHSNFPTTILSPGESYHQVCIYNFGVRKEK